MNVGAVKGVFVHGQNETVNESANKIVKISLEPCPPGILRAATGLFVHSLPTRFLNAHEKEEPVELLLLGLKMPRKGHWD